MYISRSTSARLSLVLFSALGLLAFIGPAAAGPILYCSDGPNIDLVADGCISGTASGYPGGGDGIYTNAGGGDFESAVELAILGATGVTVDLTLLGKSDEGAPFTYAPDGGGALTSSFSGTWTQTSGVGSVRFVTVKAANSFALFELPNVSSTGAYSTMSMLNNGGQQPTVSHISFWAGPPTDPSTVPEPASIVLLGSGILGALWLRKRKLPAGPNSK